MSPCSHPTLVWNLASSFATKWILLPLCVRWSAMVCATSSSRLSGVELMAETLLPRRVALQLFIRWLCPSVCLCLKMLENHGKHWLIVSFPRFPVIFPIIFSHIFPIEIASTRHVGWGFSLGFRRWTSSRPMGCLEAPGFGLQIPRGLQNSSWPPHLGRRFVSAVIWWFFWCQTFWWFYDDFMTFMTAKFRSWNIN